MVSCSPNCLKVLAPSSGARLSYDMDTGQAATDKTEHERLLYVQSGVAVRDLYEEAKATCGDLRELVGIAAQGDARPEICHRIDDHVHAIMRKHSLLLCLSHATEAVYESDSLSRLTVSRAPTTASCAFTSPPCTPSVRRP